MADEIHYQYRPLTILELSQLQQGGYLNLEPGFQRKSVWKLNDRKKLVQSLLEGYPIPSIFLYRRDDNGKLVYDVLDGKQRLETIFMYCGVKGFKNAGFPVLFQFEDDEEPYEYRWRDLRQHRLTSSLLAYRIQTAEVTGNLSDIIDLFVRINSTGKSLTSAERRNAKYHKTPLLKHAQKLAARHRRVFLQAQGIVSDTQIERMKDVELVTELLVSILVGGNIDRKAAVDRAVGAETINLNSLRKATKEFSKTIATIKKLFPELYATRFANISEFYTLFIVVWAMLRAKLVFSKSRNRQAQAILKRFSDGVDRVYTQQRKAQGAKRGEQPYVDYLLTVQRGTDQIGNRQRRAQIVSGLFAGLFQKRDAQRIFSTVQRRLLWNSEEEKVCSQCGVTLDWTNFQMDHVVAYSRGGRTSLKNAALICQSCNASKGAGRRVRGRKAVREQRAKRARPEGGSTEAKVLRGLRKLPKREGGVSRQDLLRYTGISGMTLRKTLKHLIEGGQVLALDTWPKRYRRM
jgi:hypothetical protein